MTDITVRCECSRTMRSDAAKGRGHMVCGCGRRVYVEVPNRLAYEPGQCCWVTRTGGCTRPAAGDGVNLCAEHIQKTVAYAKEHRLRLQLDVEERTRLAQLQRDLASAPEKQQREQQEKFCANVRAQRGKIMDAVAAAGEVVYYVRLAPDRIKIGVTGNLRARLGAFRAPLSSLLAVEPGDMTLETTRHRTFVEHRINRPGNREEYQPAPDLMTWIDKVRAEHGEPFEAIRRWKLAAVADLRESGPLLFGPNRGIYDQIEARLRTTGEAA